MVIFWICWDFGVNIDSCFVVRIWIDRWDADAMGGWGWDLVGSVCVDQGGGYEFCLKEHVGVWFMRGML